MECNVPVYQLRSGISRQLTTFRPDTRQKTLRIEPHQRLTLVQTEETGMVTRLWLTFPGWFWQHWNPNAEIDTTLLRCLILRIYFDGNPFPSVESPVGDFFGVGHCEYRQYLSRFLGMSSGGFYSYFPMPFEKGMRIEMENLHDSIPADIFLNVNYQALEHLDAQAGRFHCQFRCGENPGPEPMDVLQTEGRGHYVGCAVSMQGRSTTTSPISRRRNTSASIRTTSSIRKSWAPDWRIISTGAGISGTANSAARTTASR